MWKFLSRGLRETFERRIAFSRKDKGSGQDCNSVCFQNKFIPIVSSHTFDDGSADKCKNGPCNGKKQNNREHQGERWREKCQIEQFSLFGLLGWSGAMLAGWYVFQPVCRRRRYCRKPLPPDLDCLKTRAGFQKCHINYISLSRLFSHVAVAQPLSILPKKSVPTPSRPIDNSEPTNLFIPLSVDEVDGAATTTPYGPKTAEQALDEAAANLGEAQKVVLREIENSIGMACLDLGKNKEALTHFQKSAELDYAPAAYNLGLCYEMGIGTTKNLRLAAKYYELASNKGHPTAMYNLGVFHVRGWGGVPVDSSKARQLFIAAAELGQTNAKEALTMVSNQEQKSAGRKEEMRTEHPHAITTEETKPGKVFFNTSPKKLDATQAFYQLLGIKTSDRIEEDTSVTNHSLLQNRDLTPVPMVC